jgi:Methyltransferase domain
VNPRPPRRLAAALAAALLLAVPAAAAREPYAPAPGQPGKDVVWVPTAEDVAERMLAMAQTGPGDTVVDLGSGDGVIAITAARKFGARALGIEYNPAMVELARRNATAAGVAGRVTFVRGDIFASDYAQATVLTLYLRQDLNLRLRPQILSLRPGTRVVSHAFDMGDWRPDEISSLREERCYLWIVPAGVFGVWRLDTTGSARMPRLVIEFDQRYQAIGGSVTLGEVTAGLREARLRGAEVAFAFVDGRGVRREFSGRVSGLHMEGSFRADGGAVGGWTATRR